MSVPAPAPSNLNSFYLQKGTTTTTTTTRLNNDFFQLFGQPTSDLPYDYTPTRSPTTKRLLKLSGSGLNGRSPICTPFPIASLIPAPIPVMPSLLAENAMLRAKLYQAEMARSEAEKENAGYVDVLTETMAFLEHRSAVHKARVAALEQEVAGQAKVQRDQAEALEQLGAVVGQLQQDKTSLESEVARLSPFEAQVVELLRKKNEHMAGLSVRFLLALHDREIQWWSHFSRDVLTITLFVAVLLFCCFLCF
jgi:hypothetical protein